MSQSLANNVFFKTLLNNHNDIYRQASEKCWLICAPIDRSRDGIDRDFIWSHVLKPSPLLKSHFTPCFKTDIDDIELDRNTLLITRSKAKSREREEIKILKEESAYNENNQRSSILIIQKPLVDSKRAENRVEDYVETENSLKTYDECFEFLNSLSPQVCQEIRSKSITLMTTYLILPNYLEDAAQRFKAIIDWGIKEIYDTTINREIEEELLNISVESYVIGLNHDAIFKNIMNKYCKDDDKLYMQLCALDEAKFCLKDWGAQPIFSPFTAGDQFRELFDELDSKRSPIEKLYCLKKIYDLTNKSLADIVRSSKNPLEKMSSSIAILSDDVLAATIYILIRVKPRNLASNVNYINLFSWRLPSKNEMGYSLVTFEVAMNYIVNSDHHPPSKEIPIDDRPKESCQVLENSRPSKEVTSELSMKSKRPSDSTTPEKEQILDEKGPETHEEEIKLGDFLHSLKRNQFYVTYGKQT